MLAVRFQYWFYSTKTLKIFYGLRLLLTIGFFGAFLLGYALNLAYVFVLYGRDFVTLSLSPLLFLGVVMILWALLTKRYSLVKAIAIIVFLPITFFSEYGLSSDLYLFALFLISKIEKSHRTYAVKVLASFSKTYSPLYKERLANKKDYRAYTYAYRVLDCLQEEDYTLVREKTVTISNKKTGIYEKTLERTFKIKGILGTTTIKDELYSRPYKKAFFLRPSI